MRFEYIIRYHFITLVGVEHIRIVLGCLFLEISIFRSLTPLTEKIEKIEFFAGLPIEVPRCYNHRILITFLNAIAIIFPDAIAKGFFLPNFAAEWDARTCPPASAPASAGGSPEGVS